MAAFFIGEGGILANKLLLPLALLWLAGTGLRLTVLAVPPVIPLIHHDLHLSETGVALLGSLPPLLFAAAAARAISIFSSA